MTVVNVFPLFENIHSKSKDWLCFNVYNKLKTCTSKDTCRKLFIWAPLVAQICNYRLFHMV